MDAIPHFWFWCLLCMGYLTCNFSASTMAAKAKQTTMKKKGSRPSNDSKMSDAGGPITFKWFLIYMAIPFLSATYFSKYNPELMKMLMEPIKRLIIDSLSSSPSDTSRELFSIDDCYERVLVHMFRGLHEKRRDNPFEGLSIVMHRNGEAQACGEIMLGAILMGIKEVLPTMSRCPIGHLDDKYYTESFLTQVFQQLVGRSCPSVEKDRSTEFGLYGFCDMGPEKTPILHDHDRLVRIATLQGKKTFLPCHFHNYNGIRVTALPQLLDFARAARKLKEQKSRSEENDTITCSTKTSSDEPRRELHLYAVPAGRVFVFAPNHVGEIIPLPHVSGGDPTQPVYLKVLSVAPRVFDLVNFFSREESDQLVAGALKETRDLYKIKRSTTGAQGNHENRHRTSESGFDTSSPVAIRVKKRGFDVLGFDEYLEPHSDGLQILRYNLTTAYNAHMDWIDGSDALEHNYDSAGMGGNRFATILLYMSDLGEHDGGETVFTEAWPPEQTEEEHQDLDKALQLLRDSGDKEMLERGSWQETLVAKCRSRLATRPTSGRSILFYSMKPNGEADQDSRHGACPVLSGQKYAANLWVWNTPRDGFPGNPKNPRFTGKTPQNGVIATFYNSGSDPSMDNAELFVDNMFWAKLGKGDDKVYVTTVKGHIWRVLVDGKEVKRWVIETNEGSRTFVI